jgi:hypothetical protein
LLVVVQCRCRPCQWCWPFNVQPWCTCHPPDEQLLVSVGRVLSCPSSLSLLFTSPTSMIHPASSWSRHGGGCWVVRHRWGVLWPFFTGGTGVVVIVVSLPFVSPPLHCHRCSTCDPPPEQLLVGLGASGVSFITVGGCGGALVLVSVVVICFGGIWVGQHDTVHLWGSLGAYLVGIPLLGSPGIVLWAPNPK